MARASQWSRDLNYSDPTERDWGLLITEHARLRSFKMARTVKLSGGFELSCRIYWDDDMVMVLFLNLLLSYLRIYNFLKFKFLAFQWTNRHSRWEFPSMATPSIAWRWCGHWYHILLGTEFRSRAGPSTSSTRPLTRTRLTSALSLACLEISIGNSMICGDFWHK